jgi:hypothetical protein
VFLRYKLSIEINRSDHLNNIHHLFLSWCTLIWFFFCAIVYSPPHQTKKSIYSVFVFCSSLFTPSLTGFMWTDSSQKKTILFSIHVAFSPLQPDKIPASPTPAPMISLHSIPHCLGSYSNCPLTSKMLPLCSAGAPRSVCRVRSDPTCTSSWIPGWHCGFLDTEHPRFVE